MAEEHKEGAGDKVEVSDRGLFGFMGKKEEKSEEEVVITGVEKLSVEEEGSEKKEEGEKKEGLLHRSPSSSSSSSSDEEEEVEGPDGEKIKKKKKKGLKEKIKERLGGDKKEGEVVTEQEAFVASPVAGHTEETTVVVEKIEEPVKIEATPEEEKKGFLQKIKEKLPGHGHETETGTATAAATTTPLAAEEVVEGGEGQAGKEKKGFLGKIMDKLPGYHKEEKESH